MANTSATGGYLVEAITSLDIENLFHNVIMGITGIDKKLIRPRWQPNPPVIPNIEVDWCAFGIVDEKPDDNAYVVEYSNGTKAKMQRHQEIDILCSFYGANALVNASALRDGFQIAQNREVLFANGLGFVGTSNTVRAPELLNERWFNRVDITITLRQELNKDFNILPIGSIGAGAIVKTETLSVPINVIQ